MTPSQPTSTPTTTRDIKVHAGRAVTPLAKRTPLEKVLTQRDIDVRGWPRTIQHAARTLPLRLCAMHLELVLGLAIAFGVVSAWRGAWLVLDAAFLPDVPHLSAGLSLAIGGFLLWLVTIVQPLLFDMARRRPSRLTWYLDAAYSYVGLWCCVFVWRGIWQLWDQSMGLGFPPSPRNLELERSGWLSHGVGVALCFLMDATRSLNAPPMIYVPDSGPPIYGARTSPSWDGVLRLGRLGRAPALPEDVNEWRTAVGLPSVPSGTKSIF